MFEQYLRLPHHLVRLRVCSNSVYSTPVIANDIMYLANKTHLFAIENLKDK